MSRWEFIWHQNVDQNDIYIQSLNNRYNILDHALKYDYMWDHMK